MLPSVRKSTPATAMVRELAVDVGQQGFLLLSAHGGESLHQIRIVCDGWLLCMV
jgi:hypothetical protein